MIDIVYAEPKFFASFHNGLTSVAREKIFIEMIEPPPLEELAKYQRGLIEKNGPVYYAVTDGRAIGWCDIFPFKNPRLAHRGGLGMGVVGEFRGQGVGARLLEKTLAHAKTFGLEKIELSVYTTNSAAIALYKKFGFAEEGLIKNYRKLDDKYFDAVQMAKFL